MKPRRRRRRWLSAALLAALALWLVGCVSTVVGPSRPADPVTVYLVVDDRHTGIVLPVQPSGYDVYGYGDEDWYAYNHNSWYHAFDTVLWPTQGTLGRRHSRARNEQELRRDWHWMTFYPIVVDRRDVADLRRDLEAEFTRHEGEPHYNPTLHMRFVPYERGFWMLFNCHDQTAEWFERLGCSVSWVPLRLGLTGER